MSATRRAIPAPATAAPRSLTPTERAVLDAIVEAAGHGERLSIGELIAALALPRPDVRHALAGLRDAGLAEVRPPRVEDGRTIGASYAPTNRGLHAALAKAA